MNVLPGARQLGGGLGGAIEVGSVGVGGLGDGLDDGEGEGLAVGVTELAVGLGDPVGETGAVVGVAVVAAEGVGWSSAPIGLTCPPELWGSENACCERVVDDEVPSTIASATMLVTSRPMAAPSATAGPARDTRSRIHSERLRRSSWADNSVCWFNHAM
jgi:hypothetical protein